MKQKKQMENAPVLVEEKQVETSPETGKEMPTVEVIIKHHKQLFDLLNDPNKMWRVLLMLFLIIIVLFIGLSGVIIVVKKYYPYSTIETNLQGATIMKSEDKEVIYWLFNTADLWANSGIEVEEGDELTIRASGASFTAIHHLVAASDSNKTSSDAWVGTEGQEKHAQRDRLRANYRISKSSPEGILLMQVIPNKEDSLHNDYYLTHGNIEVIGKERRNLKISQAGVLRFAVNDIVLVDNNLDSMYSEFIDTVLHYYPNLAPSAQSLKESFYAISSRNSCCKSDNSQHCANCRSLTELKHRNKELCADSAINNHLLKDSVGLALGLHPIIDKDSSFNKAYPLINELVYYKVKGFKHPWYMDNIGSFLIVIERKRK